MNKAIKAKIFTKRASPMKLVAMFAAVPQT